MKNDEKTILAFILLISFSISAYGVTNKHMLDASSYSELLLAKNAVEGEISSATPLLYQLTAIIYRLSSSESQFNATLLMDIAKALPVIFSIISVVSFYFMLKHMFSEIAAAGGAILLASSQAFSLRMSSGVYYPDALGMCAFLLGCSVFFLFYSKKNYLFLLVSAVLFVLSGFSFDGSWVMIGAFALALLAQFAYGCRKKFDELLAHGTGAVSIAFLLVYFPIPHENFFKEVTTANLVVYLFNLPLAVIGAVAFIAWLIGRHRCRSGFELFTGAIFVLSLIVSVFHFFPAAFGIMVFSAFAINELVRLKDEKLTIAAFGGALFFISFIFTENFLSVDRAILASALVALTSIFIASLYRERRIVTYLVFSMTALFLFSSVGAAVLTSSQHVDRIGPAADEMTGWVSGNLPENASLWVFMNSALVEFSTSRNCYSNDTEFARFILSNESVEFAKERNITHILLDSSLFDSLETLKVLANNTKVRIDSFRLYSYASDKGNVYAVFVSRDGKAVYAQIDTMSGNLIDGNTIVVTPNGGAISVPLRKFLRVGEHTLIYPQDNYKVNLFMMFFENVNGFKKVYASEEGEIKIFEVVE